MIKNRTDLALHWSGVVVVVVVVVAGVVVEVVVAGGVAPSLS